MKRVKIALVAVFAVLAGLISWEVVKPSDEPVYKGRTLTEWLKGLNVPMVIRQAHASADVREASEAVRQVGTNAIPTLLRLLRAKDSALKLKLIGLAQRQQVIKVQFKPASQWNSLGYYGFIWLGTDAQQAVPDLIEIANQDISASSRLCAIASLTFIGRPAKQAVPCLLQCATNSDFSVRSAAKFALLTIDPEAAARAGITNAQ